MTTTPKTLNVTECHQLLDALLCKEGTHKQFRKGIRNYTMALLMLDTGLRVGEVVQLRPTDLFFGPGSVQSLHVRPEIAKNKTERIIPLSDRVRGAIEQLLSKVWDNLIGSDDQFVFYRTDPKVHITTRQVERIIRRAAMKSLGRPVHPHMLRHTFGTKIERKGGLRVAQECLGHKNVSSTQIYTHPNEDDKRKAIREACGDEQERHLMITDSSLDSRGPNSIDAAGANHNHR